MDGLSGQTRIQFVLIFAAGSFMFSCDRVDELHCRKFIYHVDTNPSIKL